MFLNYNSLIKNPANPSKQQTLILICPTDLICLAWKPKFLLDYSSRFTKLNFDNE